jgi:hypothetical protein
MRGLTLLIASISFAASVAAQETKVPGKLMLHVSFFEGVAAEDKASLGPHLLGTKSLQLDDSESIAVALENGGVAVHGQAAGVLGSRLPLGIVLRGRMLRHDAREATLDLTLSVAGRVHPAGEGFKGLAVAEHQLRLAGALLYDQPLKIDLPREWFAIAESDLLKTKDQPVWAAVVVTSK